MLRKVLPCLAVFAILVPTLDLQSIWWDEGISMHLAGLPWGAIVAERAANIHPPLYFLVLKGWSAVAGQTPFAARYLSALAAVLLPAVVQRFTGRRFGARSGRAAAVMVAMGTPFAVYGQEVRAYAWLPVLLVTLWSQVWPDPGRAAPGHGARVVGTGSGLVLGLTVAAMALAHYAGLIAAGTAAVGLLWRWIEDPSPAQRRIIVRQGLIGAGVAVVAVVPWAFALGRADDTQTDGRAQQRQPLLRPHRCTSLTDRLAECQSPCGKPGAHHHGHQHARGNKLAESLITIKTDAELPHHRSHK